jgi:hypothetical protein
LNIGEKNMNRKTIGIIVMFLGFLTIIFFIYIALFGLFVDNYTGYYFLCAVLTLIGILIFGYGIEIFVVGE